jgi:ATP-binding cassette subfamily F protein 3
LSSISGGEQRRLSLAILVASGANLLILDEPTNHLDVESREALEDALSAFEGAVILVSHDRALLEAIGTRTIVCADGELRSFPTGWVVYQRERDEREATAAAAAQKKAKRKGGRYSSAKPEQKAARRAGRLAEAVELAEAELKELEEELADPSAWSTAEKAARAEERHRGAKEALADLFARWEEAEAQVGAADELSSGGGRA